MSRFIHEEEAHDRSVSRVRLNSRLFLCYLPPSLQSSPEPVHRVPPFGCGSLRAGPRQLFCRILATWAPGHALWSPLLSRFCCLASARSHRLHSGVHQHALPDPAGIRCAGQTSTRPGQVFFFVNSGQNGAPRFTVVLHSQVFNGK